MGLPVWATFGILSESLALMTSWLPATYMKEKRNGVKRALWRLKLPDLDTKDLVAPMLWNVTTPNLTSATPGSLRGIQGRDISRACLAAPLAHSLAANPRRRLQKPPPQIVLCILKMERNGSLFRKYTCTDTWRRVHPSSIKRASREPARSCRSVIK